ncbi:class A sortase [Tissierella pigra]|uniref:Class A sortase n=1 Tax=Tissierella pigra TaxID=2607614 RepID=A0A6N7Y044_9FIRM|nr:class A sortase [Tissierella pigra]MBU5424835.1 class A sortase [Tissierella pigra]MSU02234.1 class A sortase [Tissierella pigra]
MRKFISTIIIIIGVILLFIPHINNLIIQHNINNTRNVLKEITSEEIIKNKNTEGIYDYDSIRDIEINTVLWEIKDFDNKNIIGQIAIPDLGIDIPILKGTTNSNLLIGATTMVEGQEMGEGNYPLAGHLMKNKSLLFGSLMDIEIGALVKISDKNMIYEYKIYDTVVVPDEALNMLDNSKAEKRGRPIISLMTCYYSSKTGKRFFALGELVDTYTYP